MSGVMVVEREVSEVIIGYNYVGKSLSCCGDEL